MRGAELAIRERNGVVAGRKIELIKASSDAKPDVAVNATRKLVEQDKVDIMVGPLSGGEGIAVKKYSKTQPASRSSTAPRARRPPRSPDPSPNFFRLNTDGGQWMVGLGKAALDKGYKRVMVIAEDYAFPYSQVQGFMAEYCKLGGKVPVKAWVPLGGKDYSSVIARIPKDVDALVVVLGGADAVNFLNQYEQAGGDKPMIGGSITVSQDILNYKGKRRDSLVGTIAGAPIADAYEAPEWKKFVADYKKNFPDGYPSPSLFALVYYINMKATLDGLEAVKGDLSDGQKKYREALAKMTLKPPIGDVKLDANRQAIGTHLHHRGGEGRAGQPLQQGAARRSTTSTRRSACRRPSSRSARATSPTVPSRRELHVAWRRGCVGRWGEVPHGFTTSDALVWRASPGPSAPCARSRTSRSRSPRGSAAPSSAPTAPARPRCST